MSKKKVLEPAQKYHQFCMDLSNIFQLSASLSVVKLSMYSAGISEASRRLTFI